LPYRLLEEAGLFGFRAAGELIDSAFNDIVQGRISEAERDRYFDLLMLTAGEAALAGAFGLPRLSFRVRPVNVGAWAAGLALQKFDSSPTWPHFAEPNEVRLWDVILFAGDMSKVARIAGESVWEIAANNGFARVIDRLKSTYREGGNPVASVIASSSMLDLLGIIWHSKASVLINPDGADRSVTNYLDRLPWFRERGRR